MSTQIIEATRKPTSNQLTASNRTSLVIQPSCSSNSSSSNSSPSSHSSLSGPLKPQSTAMSALTVANQTNVGSDLNNISSIQHEPDHHISLNTNDIDVDFGGSFKIPNGKKSNNELLKTSSTTKANIYHQQHVCTELPTSAWVFN